MGKRGNSRQAGRWQSPPRAGRGGLSHMGASLLVVLAVVALGMLFISRPAHADITTVKGHPILNSGAGSVLTGAPNWSATTYVTRLVTTTHNLSGNNISSVRLIGTMNSIPKNCTVTARVTLLSATGSTLKTNSLSLARGVTSFDVSIIMSPAVYYHSVATTQVTFTQSGNGC